MSLYLSRLTLSKAPAAAALDVLLNPADAAARRDAHHRLLWTVFSDGPDRRRDFLWREEGRGVFLTLSARPPVSHDLFEAPQVQEFAPVLAPGARLAFALRVNATRDRVGLGRVDVVMDALHQVPIEDRAAARMALAQREGSAWLAGQGERAGYRLLGAQVSDYSAVTLPGFRSRRKGQPQFGILEMAGVLDVVDPAVFVQRLGLGFGRAKAFGCGLMLVRRL
jgi:CRISPR system Cascade subunit CasE